MDGYVITVTRIIPLLLLPISLTLVLLALRPRAAFSQVAAFSVFWMSLLCFAFNFLHLRGQTIFQLLAHAKGTLLWFYFELGLSFAIYVVAGIVGLVWRARKDTGRVKSSWVREGIFALAVYLIIMRFGFVFGAAACGVAVAVILKEGWMAALTTLIFFITGLSHYGATLSSYDSQMLARYMAFVAVSGALSTLAFQIIALLPASRSTILQEVEAPPSIIKSTSTPLVEQASIREVSSATIFRTFLGFGVLFAVVAVLTESNLRLSSSRVMNCVLIRSMLALVALPFFYAIISLLGVVPAKRIRTTIKGTGWWFVFFLGIGLWSAIP